MYIYPATVSPQKPKNNPNTNQDNIVETSVGSLNISHGTMHSFFIINIGSVRIKIMTDPPPRC
jgi:hypothetical protein